ncbi:spermatogenesis-associated protein 7 homolog isoform X2 [Periplaneta americana]|uniref:spermatogenesis-associated protein 7 homolog isoform X2 n=1 Tax=Periplaneta americana TaxID=6978 RepID=UPI0037E88E61
MAIMKPFIQTGGNMCKSSVENHLLYHHMSNHYRRIYNAKCAVDTSPPQVYKRNRSSSRKRRSQTNSSTSCGPTECELALVDIITNDTKQSPHTYTGRTWTEEEVLSQSRGVDSSKGQHDCMKSEVAHQRRRMTHQTPCRPTSKTKTRCYRKRVPASDILERHADHFKSPDREFKPRILKTEAQSKLRDLRVYHAPIRRSRPCNCSVLQKRKEQEPEEEVMSGGTSARCSDLYDVQKLVSSKESSRDSAYNGGISSGAESRGPTPEQSSPVAILPAESMLTRLPSPDKLLTGVSTTEKIIETSKAVTVQTTDNEAPAFKRAQLQTCRKEDTAYVKFIHDITKDVLARGIYSDRGLRQLFRRHISDNERWLNLDRMHDEIARLCEQLGIPQSDDRDSCRNKHRDGGKSEDVFVT